MMSHAPWRSGSVRYWWGEDPERAATGFTWCALCGDACKEGVIVYQENPPGPDHAFFCWRCCEAMQKVAAAGAKGEPVVRVLRPEGGS